MSEQRDKPNHEPNPARERLAMMLAVLDTAGLQKADTPTPKGRFLGFVSVPMHGSDGNVYLVSVEAHTPVKEAAM